MKLTLKRNNVRAYILGKNCKNHFFLKIIANFYIKMLYVKKKHYLCISSKETRNKGTNRLFVYSPNCARIKANCFYRLT